MINLRLKAIRYGCDFRKNEHTLYQEFQKHRMYQGDLRSGETYLFVSRSEDQLIWLLAIESIDGPKGQPISLTDSRKWRIGSGGWNPSMLGNYAEACGIKLVGIRMMEEAYREERLRKRSMRSREEEYEEHIHFRGSAEQYAQ